jgi:hypothetical protein
MVQIAQIKLIHINVSVLMDLMVATVRTVSTVYSDVFI